MAPVKAKTDPAVEPPRPGLQGPFPPFAQNAKDGAPVRAKPDTTSRMRRLNTRKTKSRSLVKQIPHPLGMTTLLAADAALKGGATKTDAQARDVAPG